MHTAKSLKAKKLMFYFLYNKENSKKIYYFSTHFGFNNQFIEVMRSWPIFQKIKKKYFVLF